jgi:threonine synthase
VFAEEAVYNVPDRVFVPVGSGDGLYGLWKGFVELKKVGLARRLPKMIACQARGAAPYVNAFLKGLRQMEPVKEACTIAISISEEEGGWPALWAVYDSKGEALACSDEEIAQATSEMARAGYALEPASVATLAQLDHGRGHFNDFWPNPRGKLFAISGMSRRGDVVQT